MLFLQENVWQKDFFYVLCGYKKYICIIRIQLSSEYVGMGLRRGCSACQ